jgi:hypothetical protein
LSPRKRVLAAETEFGGAGEDNIAVDLIDEFERAVQERVAEAELQHHEQHGECDAARRANETSPVGRDIAPGKLYIAAQRGPSLANEVQCPTDEVAEVGDLFDRLAHG